MTISTFAPSEFVTEVQHPNDLTYRAKFEDRVHELLTKYQTVEQLQGLLRHQQRQSAPVDANGMTKRITGELVGGNFTPTAMKNILGPNSGTGLTDGSALIRQDLDPTVYSIFIRSFPVFEMLPKEPANGLTHAYDTVTAPDPNTTATSNTISTVVTDLATVGFTASTYVRNTSNIAVFGIGRGVSFKELAAVRGGGMPYDAMNMELSNGVIKLAYDVQTMLLQGNFSYASGTATNEGGAYNTSYFDGLRVILGSVASSNYASNNANQIDQLTLNITEACQTGLTRSAMAGGMPNLILMTYNAKQKLDQEQQNNRRYNDDTVEVMPGLRASKLVWANGEAVILPVPGFSFGSYNRTSDNILVEDIYFLDTKQLSVPWLFSENITTLELPGAVDFTLSQRYVLFGMYGLAVKAQAFMGKIRIGL